MHPEDVDIIALCFTPGITRITRLSPPESRNIVENQIAPLEPKSPVSHNSGINLSLYRYPVSTRVPLTLHLPTYLDSTPQLRLTLSTVTISHVYRLARLALLQPRDQPVRYRTVAGPKKRGTPMSTTVLHRSSGLLAGGR